MYQIDPSNGDIVITGFEKGIGDSPYSGMTDMRSVDPTSIPGEASVAFKTTPIFQAPVITNGAGSLSTTLGGEFLAASNLLLEQYQIITFSDIGTAVGAGLATGTPYVLFHVGTSGGNDVWYLYTLAGVPVTISVAGTVVFSTVNPSLPNYMVFDGSNYWMLDNQGYLWGDTVVTGGGGAYPATNSWTWMKNTVTNGHGNGLVYLNTPNTGSGLGDGWIFIFRDQAIDYGPISAGVIPTWVYGWNPNTGASGDTTLTQNTVYHQAITGPDGNMYFINSSANALRTGSVGKLQINFGGTLYTALVPSSGPSVSNYSYTDYPLIPKPDQGTCIAPSGTGMLIGGTKNFIYTWDTLGTAATGYIYLAESFTNAIVTANQNSYVFCGNRGNIYITNGSQANVWKKIPDHLSGAVYPVYYFHGATYQKGRLYFGLSGSLQTGSSFNMGGVWTIDLETGTLRCSNQLSYGTYAGYANCFLQGQIPTNTPPGVGLYIGWADGLGNYGVDVPVSTPYTSGQSYVVSDLIPIGTCLQPTTPQQFEYKLAVPLLADESVELQVASYLGGSFTSLGTTAGSNSKIILSDIFPNKIQEQQWLLVKCILSGRTSTPSYNRLTQLRIKGATQAQTSMPNLQ